jgi:hypothetical protein
MRDSGNGAVLPAFGACSLTLAFGDSEGKVFRNLRVRRQKEVYAPGLSDLAVSWLEQSPDVPVTLRQINRLPENAKRRFYRALLPPALLGRYGISPVTWQGPEGGGYVRLNATSGTGKVSLAVRRDAASPDDYYYLELEDTSLNGVNLNFILLHDPDGPCFGTDRDEAGTSTLFGTMRRNLAAEEHAMAAGLAPGQVCQGLRASRQALEHLEAFLVTIGHAAYFLEPLTYASAWLFERRGFAYVRGHKLMDDIHQAFQPGGQLHQALDGSTSFRQPQQWQTVRGRAWAIHDGILEAMGTNWDGLRMIKQVGRHAGVETFSGAVY